MALPEPDELTDAASRFVAGLTYDALNDATVDAAKKLLLDVLGAGIAGHGAEACATFRELVEDVGGKPEATVIGRPDRLPAHVAAAVNGAACRALEVDDVHERAVIHLTATIVPAALAAVQVAGRPVSGRELLTATAVGIDLATRMSLAALPLVAWRDRGRRRGMSTTYQVGVFAAAAVASRVWGFSPERVTHALGFAYNAASGNQQATYDGAQAIRLQQGLSAGAGVFAARLAGAGLTAATRPLEGEAGYYNLYWGGSYDRGQLLDGLGKRFAVDQVSIKPYPCCKCTHNAITAALAIAGREPITADDIRRVEVVIPSREYFYTVCDPIERRQRPTNLVEAQFSLPYAVSLALLGGGGPPSLRSFQAGLADHDVRSLATRVDSVLPDVESEALPAPAVVTIEWSDGRPSTTQRADISPGHPSQPLDWSWLESKYAELTTFPTSSPSDLARESLLRVVRELESVEDVERDLIAHLSW